MFSVDDRIKSLPVTRDQVVALYQSINSPHLAVPGRHAGPAQCFVVTLRGPTGFGVFVYLYLPEADQQAAYVSDRRSVTQEQAPAEESDALAFAESMGFMMDNANFGAYSPEEQDGLLRTLPVFQRDRGSRPPNPRPPTGKNPGHAQAAGGFGPQGRPPTGLNPGYQQAMAQSDYASPRAPPPGLGKLFGAFALALCLAGAQGCKHVPTAKDVEASQIHYDLGVQAVTTNPQLAMAEFDKSLELDPEMPEALNAKGMLLHVVFHKIDDALVALKKAVALKPKFSDAKTNLGNVYLDLKRYDEAIVLYQDALGDILYATPFIAEANLGWAKYMKGQTEEAIGHIKTAVTVNPKFCLGYRNLGQIYDETNQTDEACKQFAKYREACSDVPDAWLREGVCLAKQGKVAQARAAFDGCVAKAGDGAVKDDCRQLKEKLGP